MSLATAIAIFTLAVIAAAPTAATAQTHDRAFWIALLESGFAVQDDAAAETLLMESIALAGSPDQQLRDDVAYGAAAKWINSEKRFTPDQLRRVMAIWQGNLHAGLGTRGDDSVLARSFSALSLSLVAARDLDTPFLTDAEFASLLDDALAYLEGEQDLRGFEPGRGWVHAVAHTADLLRFLVRNPKLPPASHPRILGTIAQVLERSPAVFVWGEPERIGFALQSLVRRADFDAAAVEAWAAPWIARHKALWKDGPAIDPVAYVPIENAKQVMRATVAAISMELTPPPPVADSRLHLLRALGTMR